MKDVYEVLRLKENEISRVEVEVEALRVVAPLLSDDEESGSNSRTTSQAKGSPTAHPSTRGVKFRSPAGPLT